MATTPDCANYTRPPISEGSLERLWRRDGDTWTLDVADLHAEWRPFTLADYKHALPDISGRRNEPLFVKPSIVAAPVYLVIQEKVDGTLRTRRMRSEHEVACRRCATVEAIALHMQYVIEQDNLADAIRRSREPRERTPQQADVIDRARRYLESMPPSISGSFGRNAIFLACQVLVRGFALSLNDALPLALEYDARSSPRWGANGVKMKLREALHRGQMEMRSLVDAKRSPRR